MGKINFEHYFLENGLEVILHPDHTTPLAVVNLLYKVGSKDEDPNKTGFAHLFEHLMFGGSKNIPSFDTPLQKVGGENNAFTSPDLTNYYIQLPYVNLETAFWLESDRMLSLSFDQKVLDVQRKVVVEEFKQRYLNQPYGDVWLHLRPLAYTTHGYAWPTIGKEPSHIENATMDDVRTFFDNFYHPSNAILVVAGPLELSKIKNQIEKWFGSIPDRRKTPKPLRVEQPQTMRRSKEINAKVPSEALYMAFHMDRRIDDTYFAQDLLSDILGRGKSSRLYHSLVQQQKICSSIQAYVMGSTDPGLFVIEARANGKAKPQDIEQAIWQEINKVRLDLQDIEVEKVKNQAETALAIGELELLSRAMALAFAANLGNPDLVNEEANKIEHVKKTDVLAALDQILVEHNVSVLYYHKE